MTTRTDSGTALATVADRTRDVWDYYRRYTDTAIHTAATAALTAFGLLIFIDPSFAWLAIASYVLPPAVLYAIGRDVGTNRSAGDEPSGETDRSERNRTTAVDVPDASVGFERVDANADPDAAADRDFDGPDHDSDGPDGDSDGPDRDVDGPDGDTDGPDGDADGADHDHDGVDRDADGTDSDSDGLDFDPSGSDRDVDGTDTDSDSDSDRDG
jgi:hypothetical protein